MSFALRKCEGLRSFSVLRLLGFSQSMSFLIFPNPVPGRGFCFPRLILLGLSFAAPLVEVYIFGFSGPGVGVAGECTGTE